jgi:hypothetical protein
MGSVVPGTTGTPFFIIVFLASVLLPISFTEAEEGPIKVNSLSSTAFINAAFSEKNHNRDE